MVYVRWSVAKQRNGNGVIAIIIAILAVVLFALSNAANAQTATMPTTKVSATPNRPQVTGNDSGVNVYSSDMSVTGAVITNDQSTWPGGDPVWNICAAVALAEGYNLGAGCAPYDLNNPGDLSPGDESGQRTCGGPQTHDGSSIIMFCTSEGGWTALYNKFQNIINGNSSVYLSTWTWTQIAQKYAGNWQPWVNNVTSYLGVDPSSTPAQYVASNPSV
jgi:hypothetical protein